MILFRTEKKTSPLSIFSGIKHIIFIGVLCFFIPTLTAQIQPRQLRKEVLRSQNPQQQEKKTTKGKKKATAKDMQDFKPLAPIQSPLDNKRATLVYLENSETLSFDQLINPDVQVLKGNVRPVKPVLLV